MDPMKEQHQMLCRCWKKCDRDPGNDETIVWERKHELYKESPNSPKLKKARRVKSEVKSMLIIFFDINGIAHKEFTLAGQTVKSAYYCDIIW
jgi:hypothetical protein